MLKKIIFILFSLIFFSLNPLNLLAEENQPQIELYAEAAVLMDASSGRVLYGKNPSEVLAMASTTKILTCILALENGNLSDYAEVSAYAARMPQVKLNMREGEFYRLEDLLYSLMLESHNDTAVAVAEHIGGSVENFAKMMNDKAKEIGCLDSYFITPSGLDAESEDKSRFHSTTARELALIMSYCILESPQKEAFLKITGTQNYQFGNYKITDVMEYETGGRNFSLTNRNAFLSMMEGAMSGKTGFTGRAGYCYVGALERDGRVYVVSLLASGWPSNRSYKWSDTRKLMEYGLDNYFFRDVFTLPELNPIPVNDGVTISGRPYDVVFENLLILSEDDLGQRLLREDETVNAKIDVPESLNAPIEAGLKVGAVSYYLDGEKIKELSVVAETSIERIDYRFIFSYILNLFCVK